MPIQPRDVQIKLEKLVDSVAVQAQYRPVVLELLIRAYVMGICDAASNFHETTQLITDLLNELSNPLEFRKPRHRIRSRG